MTKGQTWIDKLNGQLRLATASAGVFLATLLLAMVVSSALTPVDNTSAADADSASATVNLDLAPSISISPSTDNVTLNIAADQLNTLVTADFNITVSTNNPTGYHLDLSVSNVDTNALVHTTNSAHYVPSLESAAEVADFPVNHWGYSLSTVAAATAYSPLPAAGSNTTLFSKTNGAYNDDQTNVAVGTKVGLATPAGDYTNTLVFTAITNYNDSYDYTINFDANGGTGTTPSITATRGQTTPTLPASDFTREGYFFFGWDTDPDSNIAHWRAGGKADPFDPSGDSVTLYAKWATSTPETVALADGNTWTKGSMGSTTWYNAANACPSGFHLPSIEEFDALLAAYGGTIYAQSEELYGREGYHVNQFSVDFEALTGWAAYGGTSGVLYWSSSSRNNDLGWTLYFYVDGSTQRANAYASRNKGSTTYNASYGQFQVTCIKNAS